jgi:putative FmdB family regulatory protein
MPIFEYQCDDCGSKFEKLVRRVSGPDADQVLCPQCGESHLTTQLSRFAAHGNGQSEGAMFSPQARGRMNETPSCGGGMCHTPDICGRN